MESAGCSAFWWKYVYGYVSRALWLRHSRSLQWRCRRPFTSYTMRCRQTSIIATWSLFSSVLCFVFFFHKYSRQFESNNFVSQAVSHNLIIIINVLLSNSIFGWNCFANRVQWGNDSIIGTFYVIPTISAQDRNSFRSGSKCECKHCWDQSQATINRKLPTQIRSTANHALLWNREPFKVCLRWIIIMVEQSSWTSFFPYIFGK